MTLEQIIEEARHHPAVLGSLLRWCHENGHGKHVEHGFKTQMKRAGFSQLAADSLYEQIKPHGPS